MSEAARPVAWEDDSVPFPANAGLTWWECVVSPERFFGGVSWSGPYVRPLLYFLIVVILASTLGLFWFVWGPRGPADFGLALEIQLLSFFLTPFAVLVALGVVTLALHLFVVLLVPDRQGIAATATVLCYGSGVSLVSAVFPPALGMSGSATAVLGAAYLVFYASLTVAVQVWYIVVLVIGIRRAHATTTGRAAAIVLLPVVIGAVIVAAIAITAVVLLPLLPGLVLP